MPLRLAFRDLASPTTSRPVSATMADDEPAPKRAPKKMKNMDKPWEDDSVSGVLCAHAAPKHIDFKKKKMGEILRSELLIVAAGRSLDDCQV